MKNIPMYPCLTPRAFFKISKPRNGVMSSPIYLLDSTRDIDQRTHRSGGCQPHSTASRTAPGSIRGKIAKSITKHAPLWETQGKCPIRGKFQNQPQTPAFSTRAAKLPSTRQHLTSDSSAQPSQARAPKPAWGGGWGAPICFEGGANDILRSLQDCPQRMPHTAGTAWV